MNAGVFIEPGVLEIAERPDPCELAPDEALVHVARTSPGTRSPNGGSPCWAPPAQSSRSRPESESLSGRFRISHRSLPTALVSTRSCTRSNILPQQDAFATQAKQDQERSRAFLRQYGL
jgi:hypothetical protein